MRSYTAPSWVGIILGAVLMLVSLFQGYQMGGMNGMMMGGTMTSMGTPMLLLAGAVLLAAGLLGLQTAWNNCCDWDDGCSCCGDGCSCGDCDDCCRDDGKGGHEGHGH